MRRTLLPIRPKTVSHHTRTPRTLQILNNSRDLVDLGGAIGGVAIAVGQDGIVLGGIAVHALGQCVVLTLEQRTRVKKSIQFNNESPMVSFLLIN